MEKATETWVTAPDRLVSATRRDACVVHIYPTGPGMGARYPLIDALTDIHNKRYLLEFLDRELSRSARYGRPLALIMFDIDRFKTINDDLGHLGGDFTLRELASLVKGCVRKEELYARYGGEEFIIVLPETSQEGAVAVAERIRTMVERHQFQYEGKTYPVS